MCVINIIENMKIPSEQNIDFMYEHNPHFSGIAFFNEITRQIEYTKGIEVKELKKILKYASLKKFSKIITHFRIASSGSKDNKNLNHPFEITKLSNNNLKNKTNNDIIFHNGTIDLKILNDIAIKIMIQNKDAIYPKGEISDTRLLAWILNYVDYSILNMFKGEKFVIMNGINGKITKYGSFVKVQDEITKNELVCSNNFFTNNLTNQKMWWFTKDDQEKINDLKYKFLDLGDDEIDDYLDRGYDINDIENLLSDDYLRYEQN